MAFDTDLILRDGSTSLTASGSGTATYCSADLAQKAWEAVIPQSGASGSVAIYIEGAPGTASAVTGAWQTLATVYSNLGSAVAANSGSGAHVASTFSPLPWRRWAATIWGTNDCGAVKIGAVTGGRYTKY